MTQALVNIQSQSRAVLAHHAKTFTLAARFLPARQRDDAAVVYAVCRLIDDLVDEAVDIQAGCRALDELREMLFGERRPSPLIAVFLQTAERCDIPLEAVSDLIDGVASDAGEVMVEDDAELIRYGYAVAGTVGLMMCGVIGVRDPAARAHAIDLGIAMQLTNICRDVAEDADRGRVYLPAQRLEDAAIAPRALINQPLDGKRLAPVVHDVLSIAERYYQSAEAGMAAIPWRPRMAIMAASRVYRAIGFAIARQRFDVTRGRAHVSASRKAMWVTRALWASAFAPFLTHPPHDGRLHAPLSGITTVRNSVPRLRLVRP